MLLAIITPLTIFPNNKKRLPSNRQPFLKTKNKKCTSYKDLFCNAFHFSINVCLLYTLSVSGKSHPLTNVTL